MISNSPDRLSDPESAPGVDNRFAQLAAKHIIPLPPIWPVSNRTNAMVVEISRPSAVASSSGLNASGLDASSLLLLRLRCGSDPPSLARISCRYFIYSESGAGR